MKIDAKKRDVLKMLEGKGFFVVSEKEHIKLKNDAGTMLSIPNHKTIKGSTLKTVCSRAGFKPW
jgi:predicted RNA binding protein YcfA (HicA-like mRNA interferase family)